MRQKLKYLLRLLKQIAPPSPVKDIKIEDVRIRILGEVALIHARTMYLRSDGERGARRDTDIWERRSGRWLCVAAHVTRG